jgi:hypothetical protein
MFSSQTQIKSLEEKISILTNKNRELQTGYNNSLETLGRMALHANLLEKEFIHLREKYESLLEENKLLTECSSSPPVRQRAYESFSSDSQRADHEKEYKKPFSSDRQTAYEPFSSDGQTAYEPFSSDGQRPYEKEYNETFCKPEDHEKEEFKDNSNTEKRSIYDFAIPLSAIESGYITRQTNALSSDIENESLVKSNIRRSNRNKK